MFGVAAVNEIGDSAVVYSGEIEVSSKAYMKCSFSVLRWVTIDSFGNDSSHKADKRHADGM